MTAHANAKGKVSTGRIIFVLGRTAVFILIVVFALVKASEYAQSNQISIPPFLYNFLTVVLILLAAKFGVGDLIKRLAAESEDKKNI